MVNMIIEPPCFTKKIPADGYHCDLCELAGLCAAYIKKDELRKEFASFKEELRKLSGSGKE